MRNCIEQAKIKSCTIDTYIRTQNVQDSCEIGDGAYTLISAPTNFNLKRCKLIYAINCFAPGVYCIRAICERFFFPEAERLTVGQ